MGVWPLRDHSWCAPCHLAYIHHWSSAHFLFKHHPISALAWYLSSQPPGIILIKIKSILQFYLEYNWFIKGKRGSDFIACLITPHNNVFIQIEPFYISATLGHITMVTMVMKIPKIYNVLDLCLVFAFCHDQKIHPKDYSLYWGCQCLQIFI